jgi:hypothetical protein
VAPSRPSRTRRSSPSATAPQSPSRHVGRSADPEPVRSVVPQPVGNDLLGTDYGYKLHLVYGAWRLRRRRRTARSTTRPRRSRSAGSSPRPRSTPGRHGQRRGLQADLLPDHRLDQGGRGLPGGARGRPVRHVGYRPVSAVPGNVLALFAGTVSQATPTAPTYNNSTHVITIPTVTGVIYKIGGVTKTGTVTITQDTVVNAVPAAGYVFAQPSVDEWFVDYS